MNIHLQWNQSETPPLALFNLEIIQEENCFAKARLVVDALAVLPPAGTEGMIVIEDILPPECHAEPLVPAKAGIISASKEIPKHPREGGDQDDNGVAEGAALQPQPHNILFKGLLVGTLTNIEGAFGEIELIAKPLDFVPKNKEFQTQNRKAPYWDALLIPPEKLNHFAEIQDVRTASLFCHPRTGELLLSDWFEGRETFKIYQNFFYQSLQMKVRKPPLESCTVNLHAHWVQGSQGIANLGPTIRKAFPYKRVNTYTEAGLTEKWPQSRKHLGRSGVWVLKSKLKPINPAAILYPPYSPPLSLGEVGEEPKTYRAKRYWFKPVLWVRWKRKQKRKETLSLTLYHEFQRIHPGEGEHKTINFTLQNINPDPNVYSWEPDHFYDKGVKIIHENRIYKCNIAHTAALTFEENQNKWIFKKAFQTPLGDPARASFFLTDRGYQVAEHGMEHAKVMLADSARCLEVSFEGTWESLKDITTDCSVILKDPRLPGGEIRGKVIKVVLQACGETGERTVHVTLLSALGTGKFQKLKNSPTPDYSGDTYAEQTYQVYANAVSETPSGVLYFRYDDQGPGGEKGHGPLIRRIELKNSPQDQETEMLQFTGHPPSALAKALEKRPTGMRIFFKDLRTKESLEHVMTVKMARPWTAPRQVLLGI
jgi:hypothetical protein